MRVAVIFYHKNISVIYKKEWIKDCVESIKAQTHQEFDVFELNYGGTEHNYAYGVGKKHRFFSGEFHNHINAMNWLIDKVFEEGYDVVINTNMDDSYSLDRIEKQLAFIKHGYQLISSDFCYIEGKDITKKMDMSKFDIGIEFKKNHNVIAHPAMAMHKSFWQDGLRYKDLIGYEDLDLWQRAYAQGKKFLIVPEYLLFYRLHTNQITKHHGGKPTYNRHK